MPNQNDTRTGRQKFADFIGRGGRFVGRVATNLWHNSPVYDAIHGDVGRAAMHANPVSAGGGLISAIADAVRQGRADRATPLGAYGPMASGYMGGTGGGPSSAPAQVPTWGATDWSQFIPPDANMGPPQFSAPTRDPGVNRYGRMGPSAVDVLTAVGGLGGRAGVEGFLAPNAAMSGMNMNPAGMKLSGIYFGDQEQER